MLRFTIHGDPRPKGSFRAGVSPHGKAFLKESAGEGLKTWRERLAAGIASGAGPSPEPVAAFAHFRFSAPKKQRWPWPIAKNRNDIDKLVRAVLDHLSGVVVEDDSQVVLLVATKSYGPPGVEVIVQELSALADPDHRGSLRLDLASLLLQSIGPLEIRGEVSPSNGGRRGAREGDRAALPFGATS